VSRYHRIRSFGVIEALIASMIIVVLVSAAVVLASISVRSSSQDTSFHEAEHLSEDLIEQLFYAKSNNLAYFTAGTYSAEKFPIECFDTDLAQTEPLCKSSGVYKDGLPYNSETQFVVPSDLWPNGGFVRVKQADIANPSVANDYFYWKLDIYTPGDSHLTDFGFGGPAPIPGKCREIGGVSLPAQKCRLCEIEIQWTESTGDKRYFETQYLTDWEG